MRILLIPSSYLPVTGGLQRVVALLASGLAAQGNDVRIVTQRHPRTLPHAECMNGVPVERWFFMRPQISDLRHGRPDLLLAGLVWFPLSWLHLIWLLATWRPVVVNMHFVGAQAPFVVFARALLHFRLVVSLHGDDVQGLAMRSRFDRWVFSSVVRQAAVVTACSQALLKTATEAEPSIAGKGTVIHNGLDELPPADPDGRGAQTGIVRFFAAGRLVRKKGFDVLLGALARLRLTREWRLALVGDGPERSALESECHRLGLGPRVEFHGDQSHAALYRILAGATVVVVPSRDEPFGLVALEGMAAGKPVVATRTGGLPEVLEGADALVAAPESIPALAQALESAVARVEQDAQYGARNRDLARQFSAARMTERYALAFEAGRAERGT